MYMYIPITLTLEVSSPEIVYAMARKSIDLALKLANNTFWLRKMRTAFRVYDTNQDKVISVDDFILQGERFGKKCPERAEEIMNTLTNIWTVAAGSRDAKLTEKAWIDTRIKFSALPDARYLFREYSNMKFGIIDQNKSNFISQQEFNNYFECVGIDIKHAPAAFKALDSNEDGKISKDEFLDHAVEFCFGLNEEHPSKLFYGPLVD